MLLALIATYYAGIATRFSWKFWPTTSGGFIFNSQLRSLLDGRLDIDPGVIGMEGFVRDGLTYTYFGILPALLRLPLVDQLWRDWTTLSCIAASTLASLALLMPLRDVQRQDRALSIRMGTLAFGCTLIFSGPQLELLGKPSVYVEAIAWSYTFACGFLWLVMPVLGGAPASRGRLALLALCAALAVLTRVSTGLALYCALGMLVLSPGVVSPSGLKIRPCLPAAAILLLGVVVCGIVNQLRWDAPWQFADLSANRYYQSDPARMARLDSLGAFDIERLPHALRYYFAPEAFFSPARDSQPWREIQRLFDGPEGPPASLLATMPLWWVLAAVGLCCSLTRPCAKLKWRTATISAGLLVAPVLMTTYLYLAFRYRAEFAPLLLLFAFLALAVRGVRPWGLPTTALLVTLGTTQIVQSHLALRAHGCSGFGSWQEDETPNCHFFAPEPTPQPASTP